MAFESYNVGIIGYGTSAKIFHIPLLAVVPELKLYAIVQRNPTPDNNAEKDHNGIRSYRSSHELFQDNSVDVVIVTTTPDTHFELTKLALESGKHVVVEKPFTPSSREAKDLIAIAEKHHRLLTVYQNRRWDSDFLTLSQLLHDKIMGRIVELETHFDRHRPEVAAGRGWKTKVIPGGGAVYDLGAHLIDQVVVMLGVPKKITGLVGTQRENNTNGYEDSFTILLHYDGILATVKAGVVSPEVNQLRYWVRGVNGSYKKFHLDCQEDQLKQGLKPGDPGFGTEPSDRHGILTVMEGNKLVSTIYPTVESDSYSAFYNQLAKALAGRGQVPVDPNGPAEVIRLIELARKSSEEWKTLDV